MTRREATKGQEARSQRNGLAGFDKLGPGIRGVQIRAQPVENLIAEFSFDALPLGLVFRFGSAFIARPNQFAVEVKPPVIDGDVKHVKKFRSKPQFTAE